MKQYKEKVKKLILLCEDFINATKICGNECAWTDRKLETILEYAEKIKKEYNKDGGNL